MFAITIAGITITAGTTPPLSKRAYRTLTPVPSPGPGEGNRPSSPFLMLFPLFSRAGREGRVMRAPTPQPK
jgi:hypothetical protein